MSILLERLDDSQLELLELIWPLFAEHKKFPVYNYVEHEMRRRGLDAAQVLATFPSIRGQGPRGRYSPIWTNQGGAGILQKDTRVCLTMAGLFHIDDRFASDIIEALLAYMRALSAARDRITDHPFSIPEIKVPLRKALKEAKIDENIIPWAAAVADHEWPGMYILDRNPGSNHFTGQLGALVMDANFATIEDYLNAITAATTPQEPTSVLERRDPRGLARAITFFDITCEVVLRRQLVRKPTIDRSAVLMQPAETYSDFQAGLSVLGEVLSELQVPGERSRHTIGRILEYLSEQLPGLNQARVEEAIELMDAVRKIRNSTQHPRTSATLIEAHDLLGLPFPIHDSARAWDIIRSQMDLAFSTLQEEIYAARSRVTRAQPQPNLNQRR